MKIKNFLEGKEIIWEKTVYFYSMIYIGREQLYYISLGAKQYTDFLPRMWETKQIDEHKLETSIQQSRDLFKKENVMYLLILIPIFPTSYLFLHVHLMSN